MEGIKESKEVIVVIRALADFIKKAKVDGEINWWDLPSAGPVIIAVNNAVKGADKIADELKDLSSEESSELIMDLVNAAYALVQAVVVPKA